MSIRDEIHEMAQALLEEWDRTRQQSDVWLCLARKAIQVSSATFARELRVLTTGVIPTYWPK